MTANAAVAGIGHNSQAMTLEERLASDHETLRASVTAALDAARALPSAVESDEDVARVSPIVKMLISLTGKAEDARVREKEPYLDGGRRVDAWFADIKKRLQTAKDILDRRNKAYLDAKAKLERERREAAERAAREETERRLREARAAEEAGRPVAAEMALEEAASADTKANALSAAATASVKDLARVRAADTTTSLKTEWAFEIEDLGKVDLLAIRAFLPQSAIEQALRGAVRAGYRQIPGVRIFEVTKTTYR